MTGTPAPSEADRATRFGTIVLAGRPNAGKSTLLNALVGEKLAIVSRKPQSTRCPVMGLVTDESCQLMFVDPPGLFAPSGLLQESMLRSATDALQGADAVLYVHPITDGPSPGLGPLAPSIEFALPPTATVLAKADLLPRGERPSASPPVFVVSAVTGEGVAELLDWCRSQAPFGDFRYDADDIGTQPLRFFVAELVRESAFEVLEQELPYAMAAVVDEFREGQTPVYIRVILYVERESQKGIVIGKGGRTIKAIGATARGKVEDLVGGPVYLDLWVKVLTNWRKSPGLLKMLGLPVRHGKGGAIQ
jgi:GTP-binding protein Era